MFSSISYFSFSFYLLLSMGCKYECYCVRSSVDRAQCCLDVSMSPSTSGSAQLMEDDMFIMSLLDDVNDCRSLLVSLSEILKEVTICVHVSRELLFLHLVHLVLTKHVCISA